MNETSPALRFQLPRGSNVATKDHWAAMLDADGSGIPDEWVHARNDDNVTGSAQSNSDGSFSITVPIEGHLPPGGFNR